MRPAQRKIYEAIRILTERNGQPPTYDEIAAHCGLASIASVHKQVQALLAGGKLFHARNSRSRSLLLEPEGPLVVISGFARDLFCPACSNVIPAGATHKCSGREFSVTKAA